MWTRIQLKTRAKAAFKANFWPCVLTALILTFAIGGNTGVFNAVGGGDASSTSSMSSETAAAVAAITGGIVAFGGIAGLLLKFFALNPIIVGCRRFFVMNGREHASLREIIFAFSNSYLNVVKIMFFRDLYTFLWTLLLIIPGIVKSYEYRMIPMLLAENPDLSKEEAFDFTKIMMYGDKFAAFVLDLSFILWHILGGITFGIVEILYVMPYVYQTDSELYEALVPKLPQNVQAASFE